MAARSLKRLGELLRRPAIISTSAVTLLPDKLGPARQPLKMLYDDIGTFLFSHRLDLTALNFGCAHQYLSGSDRAMVEELDRAARTKRLSNSWIEDFVSRQDDHVVTPDVLQAAVAQMEEELDRCLASLGRSADHQADYSAKLEACSSTSCAGDLIAELQSLTRRMIEQSRLAEEELRLSHARIGELHTTLHSARQASNHDHLTGLTNRRGFERKFELWQGDTGGKGVIAICDIDNFKTVNDRFGHETGDRVLQFVAGELRTLENHGNSVARFGGEEFVVLLPCKTLKEAADGIDDVRRTLAARRLIESVSHVAIGQVTFSAGLTVAEKTEDLSAALRRADTALYAAKHAGRNRIYGAFDREQPTPL